MFQRITDTHILSGGLRFVAGDELPVVLEHMRDGIHIQDDLWRKVRKQSVRAGALLGSAEGSADPRLNEAAWLDGDECGIAWQTVARWMTARSKRDAARAGETLYVVPAIDVSHGKKSPPLTDAARRELLTHVNAMDTGKMAGMCPIHVGQRVRLSTNLSADLGLVPETEATVCKIDLHEEDRARAANAADPVVILQHHPLAVYLQLDKEADGKVLPTLWEKLAKNPDLPEEVRRMIPKELAELNILALQVGARAAGTTAALRGAEREHGRRGRGSAGHAVVPVQIRA